MVINKLKEILVTIFIDVKGVTKAPSQIWRFNVPNGFDEEK